LERKWNTTPGVRSAEEGRWNGIAWIEWGDAVLGRSQKDGGSLAGGRGGGVTCQGGEAAA
jgi:hypothetical protein